MATSTFTQLLRCGPGIVCPFFKNIFFKNHVGTGRSLDRLVFKGNSLHRSPSKDAGRCEPGWPSVKALVRMVSGRRRCDSPASAILSLLR